MASKIYEGIDKDPHGAMNHTGNIIRDAWMFGLLSEDETCAGWDTQRMEALYDEVTVAWEPYGGIPSELPPELLEKHRKIYGDAVKRARELGWNPHGALESDH